MSLDSRGNVDCTLGTHHKEVTKMSVAIFAKYLLPHPSPLTCHSLLPVTTFEYTSTCIHSLLTLLRSGGNSYLFTFFPFTHTLSHTTQKELVNSSPIPHSPANKDYWSLKLRVFQWLPITNSELDPMRIPPEGSVTFACRLVEWKIKFWFPCLKAIGLAILKTLPRDEALWKFAPPIF